MYVVKLADNPLKSATTIVAKVSTGRRVILILCKPICKKLQEREEEGGREAGREERGREERGREGGEREERGREEVKSGKEECNTDA